MEEDLKSGLHRTPSACVIKMLENSFLHTLGEPITRWLQSPLLVQTYTDSQIRIIVDKRLLVFDEEKRAFVHEIADNERVGRIVSISTDEAGTNCAAISSLLHKHEYLTWEPDLRHR